MADNTGADDQYEFTALDLKELSRRKISPAEAQRQLQLLCEPPCYTEIARPCSIGDGIFEIDSSDPARLLNLHRDAAQAGRFIKFVPASGAATRMFRELNCVLDAQNPPSYESLSKSPGVEDRFVYKFLSEIESFPFADELKRRASAKDLQFSVSGKSYLELLKILLFADALNFAQLPKALLPFHRYAEGEIRSALEEHLIEAVLSVKDSSDICRIHFTVSDEHLPLFKKLLKKKLPDYEARFSCKFEINFSAQKPSTDTLAVSLENEPFHDERGILLFRPAGHGALIENLNDLRADLVYIKNIDNVQRDEARDHCMLCKKLLAGKLIELQNKVHGYLKNLYQAQSNLSLLPEIADFAQRDLSITPPAGNEEERARYLLRRLNAPIRVCGVVRNTGEPGGGPFWVRSSDGGLSLQIVESAQVDASDRGQRRLYEQSTHFNPVDIVCGLRNYEGNQFDLHDFIDHKAIIKIKKSYQGRDLISCERPGLWNGGMAGWLTVFVEVPAHTFTPVKTVNDLLRPAHKGA